MTKTEGRPYPFTVRASELLHLTSHRGPVASVYLQTLDGDEVPGRGASLRWQAARSELEAQGTPTNVLAHLDAAVPEAVSPQRGFGAIADERGILHVEYEGEPPSMELARWDTLPVLAPLVRWRQDSPPYVLVLTDRRGADVTAVAIGGDRDHETVEPESERPLTKVAPGGWSQRRYQQRAENTWESNAGAVAEVVARAADDVGAEVIVVGGDVRAVELLEESLPDRLLERVEAISGGRAPGGDNGVHEATGRWVATAAARSTVELLEKFREEIGQADRAVEGVEPTLHALNEGRVEVLLFNDDPAHTDRALFGSEPTPVTTDAAILDALGVTERRDGRVVDAAIRAALHTGAGVWVVPRAGGPAGGLGGILRWG